MQTFAQFITESAQRDIENVLADVADSLDATEWNDNPKFDKLRDAFEKVQDYVEKMIVTVDRKYAKIIDIEMIDIGKKNFALMCQTKALNSDQAEEVNNYLETTTESFNSSLFDIDAVYDDEAINVKVYW